MNDISTEDLLKLAAHAAFLVMWNSGTWSDLAREWEADARDACKAGDLVRARRCAVSAIESASEVDADVARRLDEAIAGVVDGSVDASDLQC